MTADAERVGIEGFWDSIYAQFQMPILAMMAILVSTGERWLRGQITSLSLCCNPSTIFNYNAKTWAYNSTEVTRSR